MNKEKRKFFHDLRTPLAVIKLNLDLLKLSGENKENQTKIKKFRETINKELNRIIKKISEYENNGTF